MWLAASPGEKFPQGIYRYMVSWTDGSEECGKADFSNDREIEILHETIRQKGRACRK
jgi:hypothetical protein